VDKNISEKFYILNAIFIFVALLEVTIRFNLLILNVFHLMNLSIRYVEGGFQFFNHTYFSTTTNRNPSRFPQNTEGVFFFRQNLRIKKSDAFSSIRFF
jgi:hypothetical protein